MYKHLLVAVDGSKLSQKAVAHAIALAKPLKAKLTAFYVAVKAVDHDYWSVGFGLAFLGMILLTPTAEQPTEPWRQHALRVVSEGVNRYAEAADGGLLLITHYTRILRYIQPQFVHVFVGGRIVESGGPELADELDANGYERFTQAVGSLT